MQYEDFLRSKMKVKENHGIDIADTEIPDVLFPHQKDSLKFALKRGRSLLALSFGLGKTIIQASVHKIIQEKLGGKTLVICPLGVRQEFTHKHVDGRMYPIDIGVSFKYVTSDTEIENSDTPYLLTNYERVRDGNIDPRKHNFTCVTLDEGAIIRSLGSKTYHIFEEVLADIPHRHICTATPSPNEFRELIYYANILGVRDSSQSLTRWFGRDVNKAGNLQLLPQYEEEFWLWVSTWALFLYRPSDLGYSDEGYELPKLNVYWHRLPVDYKMSWNETDNHGQFRMLPNSSNSATEMHRNKRSTVDDRVAKAKEIIDNSETVSGHDGILLWHHYEYERKKIAQQIPDAVPVYGSQNLELRESRIVDFEKGKFKILATKPQISGSGCNFQHWAHRNIFMSLNFKFADFIQSIHRTYRFLQPYPVDVHIIYSEAEDSIASAIRQKWEKHNFLTEKMRSIVQKYGLSTKALVGDIERTIGIRRQEEKGKLYTAVNNDNVPETQSMEDNSVDLIVSSIPFDNHYEYTERAEDFSFNSNDFRQPLTSGFWDQMDYLTPELLRISKPGRKAVIHVKDRILYSYQTEHGLTSVFPFSDETVMHFIKHGWVYEGRRTIVTDVVRENNSTYRLGYTEMSKDATKMGSGLPEYLLTFRKPNTDATKQYADERVTKFKYDNKANAYVCGNCEYEAQTLDDLSFVEKDKIYTKYRCPQCGKTQIFYSRGQWQLDADDFWQSSGNALVSSDMIYNYHEHWQRMHDLDMKGNLSASYLQEPPVSKSDYVWDDIVFMQCLNSNQTRRKTTNHICPLPLDIVERSIILYSDIGDVVLDPFAGLFTVPYCAIKLGRVGYGIELNTDYYNDGKLYCEQAEQKKLAPTLFDLLEETKQND